MKNPLVLYKALSEETRLKSLLLMQNNTEVCVCDLTNALTLSQPKISRHLAELRKHNIVLDVRRGKWVYYRINPSLPQWAKQILEITLANNQSFIDSELAVIKPQACLDEDSF